MVFYGITCPIRLIEFAALSAICEEAICFWIWLPPPSAPLRAVRAADLELVAGLAHGLIIINIAIISIIIINKIAMIIAMIVVVIIIATVVVLLIVVSRVLWGLQVLNNKV